MSQDCKHEEDIQDLNTRLQVVEHSHARMKEAFIKNDLGLPDFDGHRVAHKHWIEESSVLDNYKQGATKAIIAVVISLLASIFALGFWEWMKAHLK